jgi:peptidoglycan/LPS O-acetylase OafA/YrhL
MAESEGVNLTSTRPEGRAALAADRTFRPDVQGLRAIAVSLVVVYHLYPSALPGGYIGVDVFFVISGFLITGHLLRTYQRTGRIGFVDFYARRARRLMPAAAVVLAVTWVAARIALPSTQLPDTAAQIRASALYFQNWVLSHDAVSYLKSDNAPSPVQHFWSLSVEEQFYLVWPLLFLIAGAGAARFARRARTGRVILFALAAGVVCASLWYSIHETAANPAAAYFVTTTRMWELGLGGLLALIGSRATALIERIGPLAWVGLGLVVSSAFLLTGASAFPGYVALLPVGGAILLIACGSAAARGGPARFTSLAPVVFLGDISYSLYLWHWPVIVVWKSYSGGHIGLLDGPLIVAVSVLLAWGTKVLIEDRVRLTPFFARHKWRSLATVFAAVVPVALVSVWIAGQPGPFNGRLDRAHPGAAALAGDVSKVANVPAVPPLTAASTDYEAASNTNCQAAPSAVKPVECVFGDRTDPTMTVALVGDSVAGQWSSALANLATRRGWKLVAVTHSSCPWTATLTTQTGKKTPYTACDKWGATVLNDLVTRIKPDVVITSDRPTNGVPDNPKSTPESRQDIGEGMAKYWTDLGKHGIPVVAIQESPEMGKDIPTCLAARGGSPAKCSVPADKAIYTDTAVDTAARTVSSAAVVDLNPFICTAKVCPPVVGNVVVYRDSHHLTKTYTLSLEPYLEKSLLATSAFRARA